MGGAAAGVGVAGGAYEYQNKEALEDLGDDYKAGKIKRKDYERRKDEIGVDPVGVKKRGGALWLNKLTVPAAGSGATRSHGARYSPIPPPGQKESRP